MVDKIEMSLDEIIQAGKKTNGGNRRGAQLRRSGKGGRPVAAGAANRRQGVGSSGPGGRVLKGGNRGGIVRNRTRGDVNSAWKHDLYDGPKGRGGAALAGGKLLGGGGGGGGGTSKLLVSNLDYGVSESDIHELFADFGPLKSASVHYDRSGRSLGTADVVFERRADAVKAMKQYNGVPLDGRPMNIQLATSEVPAAALAKSRLTARPQPLGQRGPVRRNFGGRPRGTGGGAASFRGRLPRGGPRANTKGPAPTAEELDAELDAYVNDMK